MKIHVRILYALAVVVLGTAGVALQSENDRRAAALTTATLATATPATVPSSVGSAP
jgi:hypothetical protein